MNTNFKKYIILWLSQSVSQLGSAMTSFALILWAYEQEGSALTVSLMTFCNFVPYIFASLFAGGFVDQHSKKAIMLASDTLAAACTIMLLLVSGSGHLQIGYIYIVNCIIGMMNAFQGPASAVAVGKLVPQDKLANVSGMQSFSSNLTSVLAPVIAASLYGFSGLHLILLFDLSSFVLAFLVLLLLIQIPEEKIVNKDRKSPFSGCGEGFNFLLHNKGILTIVVTMALLNFFSRLTYENILSPMILSRSGGDSLALGTVNALMGMGGILGGVLVSTGKVSKNSIKMIYVSASISFILGDLLMGVGRNTLMWSIAGVAASLPIPFIGAGQNVILYSHVPSEMQGRVFAVRNAIQYSTIPIGILLGGVLADYVFEPFMTSDHVLANGLRLLVGEGAGSGMAIMFLCTGMLGCLFSVISYGMKEIQKLQ